MGKNPGFWSVTGRERRRIRGSGAFPDGNGEESGVLERYRTGMTKNPGFWAVPERE